MDDIVSVYLVTMNRLEMLKRAVNSVLEQNGIKLELTVVDNGSSDGTSNYLEDLCQRDSRVNYIRLKENKGACYARNIAIEKSSGKYVTGLDDDDYFCPGRLHQLLSTYQENHCAFTYADDGFVINGKRIDSNNKPKQVDLNRMLYRNYVGNQVLSEKAKFEGVGGFDESLSALQDYDLWLRMVKRYGMGKKTASLLQYIDLGDHKRISSSTRKFSGYMRFYRKHKHAMTASQRRHQLLTTKHDCRDHISLANYLRLFDRNLLRGKLRIFLNRVIKPSVLR